MKTIPLTIGVSSTQYGATISIMQPHEDGTVTVLHLANYANGDWTGRFEVIVEDEE